MTYLSRLSRSGLRHPLCHALGAGALLAALTGGSLARAADLTPDGHLVFAKDALATYGFESLADLQAAGANAIAWSSTGSLVTTALVPGDEVTFLAGAADALEGSNALLLRQGLTVGLALRDDAVFQANGGKRFSVTMWGRSFGAEPVLEIVYAHNVTNVGPGLMHVVAIRTGRETSDGWVEYSTGPIDGAVWGTQNGTQARAIVLSARYATDQGASTLLDSELGPNASSPPQLVDPAAYAVVDAVELRPEAGPAMGLVSCSQATLDAACGPGGECVFGHCVDASLLWGPVPVAMDHRVDLVARWAFQTRSLLADRQASKAAAATFAGAATALAGLTSPRGYYGKLNELVAGVRDSHTVLGRPPSLHSIMYPIPGNASGPLDVCFGVARNDLGSGDTVFALFDVGSKGAITEALKLGDVLTAIDGMTPGAWLSVVAGRFAFSLPNDPLADPSHLATLLPSLLGRYATTVSFSRCQSGGGCAPLPDIPVAAEVFAHVQATGGTLGYSLSCSLRFLPSVGSPPIDGASSDSVVEETVNGITSVQFDGFSGLYTDLDGFAAWKTPMSAAFAGGSKVLVDARVGHGGKFTLGKFLFHLLRGTDQPYGVFAMPRGAHDDPDPPWLFTSKWDACPANDPTVDACDWTGNNSSFAVDAAPAGAASRIAWVNGNDVSMNDIVPRLLQGRTAFRVFGPHPSHGAYGEIAFVPPIEPSWSRGSLQVLDMRFGATPAAARAGTWESGKGVVPDQVVAQKVSDILMGQDTLLVAAKAWLAQ